MKQMLSILVLVAATSAAIPAMAMPIGLRTAVWGVSAANGRAAVANLLPENGGDAGINVTIGNFSDPSLAANIANAADYAAFREWALASGERADALAASPTAWLSFATDSSSLVAEPKDGDLVINQFFPPGADGKAGLVFSLQTVAVGKDALPSRLQTVFGVVGAETLETSAFSARGLSYSLSPTGDGRVRAVVEPGKDASGSAPASLFLRVKMN